jgi:hypothetical protein
VAELWTPHRVRDDDACGLRSPSKDEIDAVLVPNLMGKGQFSEVSRSKLRHPDAVRWATAATPAAKFGVSKPPGFAYDAMCRTRKARRSRRTMNP